MAKATGTKTATKTPAKKATASKTVAPKAVAAKKTAATKAVPKVKAAAAKPAAAKPAKPLSNADLMAIAKAEAARSAMPKVSEERPAKTRAKKGSSVDPSIATKQNALAAAQFAIERKAENVRLLELKDVTSITDYFVVCSADTDRQVKAIAENVIVEMRDNLGQQPWRSEGWDTMRWVIIDFVDFVVHVLQSEAREFYNIERLWADAPSELVEDTATKPKRASRKKSSTDDDSEAAPAKRSKIRVIEDIDAE
jgi:ribosome-associated protein